MKLSNHQGILIGLCILVSISLICHLSNYLFPKNKECKERCLLARLLKEKFGDQNPMSRYNTINYLDLDECVGLPCSRVLNEDHPDIPCNVYKRCLNTLKSGRSGKRKLTDDELKILYLTLYNLSSDEAISRRIR